MKMKKTIALLATASVVLLSANFAFATKSTDTGGVLKIAAAASKSPTNGGGDFTFSTSPNVLMVTVTSPNAYTMGAYNFKTNTTNGMAYGTDSNASGYAQEILPQNPLSTCTKDNPDFGPISTIQNLGTSAAGTFPTGGNWHWMGGSGASS